MTAGSHDGFTRRVETNVAFEMAARCGSRLLFLGLALLLVAAYTGRCRLSIISQIAVNFYFLTATLVCRERPFRLDQRITVLRSQPVKHALRPRRYRALSCFFADALVLTS